MIASAIRRWGLGRQSTSCSPQNRETWRRIRCDLTDEWESAPWVQWTVVNFCFVWSISRGNCRAWLLASLLRLTRATCNRIGSDLRPTPRRARFDGRYSDWWSVLIWLSSLFICIISIPPPPPPPPPHRPLAHFKNTQQQQQKKNERNYRNLKTKQNHIDTHTHTHK